MTAADRMHYQRCGLRGCARCRRYERWTQGQRRLVRQAVLLLLTMMVVMAMGQRRHFPFRVTGGLEHVKGILSLPPVIQVTPAGARAAPWPIESG